MKKIAAKIFASILFVFSFVAFSQAQSIDASALDAIVNEAMKHWQTPGAAVVIVRGDEVIYIKGFGVKDVKSERPVTPDTLFAIGSTTKAFTTAAMGILVDQGLMNWDDPVRKHLPSFRLSDPLANEGVTMRDIVSHRTGLIRHDLLWYNAPWGRQEIIKRIGFVPLTYPFRTTFQYQNIMFLTAGEAVAATAGVSYEEFVRSRLFAPLGMKSANFSVVDSENAADHATPHERKGDKLMPIAWRNIDNVAPAGSINASVRDLSGWIRMQLNNGLIGSRRVLSAESMREMHTPQQVIRLEGRWKLFFPESETLQLSYGLGWFINDYRGHKLVMHGGTIDGFRASIMLEPKAKLGVAVLANLNGTQMPEATGYSLMDHLLGLPKKDWNATISASAKEFEAETVKQIAMRNAARKKDTRPSHELAGYAGAYEDPAYGRAEVMQADGKLSILWSNFKSGLDHFHYDTFVATDDRLRFEQASFLTGPDGEVTGMNFLGVNFKKLRARATGAPAGQ
jgi:CubicO group peptidase (beta-lactamase class C family)